MLYKFWNFTTKKMDESNEVLQMSTGDLTSSRECEYKLHYKYQKLIKPPKSIYLVQGSIFHSVIEQDLRYKVNHGKNKKWAEIQEMFASEWQNQTKDLKDFGKYSELEAKNKCLNYIRVYFAKMSPMLYPLNHDSIEKFFVVFVNFQGKRLGFTGKVDMIGKDLFVIDHKTASSPWNQSKADEEIQAQVYPYCLSKLGYEIRGFKFNVVCKNDVTPYQVEYDTKKVKKILTDAFAVKDRIENNAMLRAKSDRVCRFCDFKSVCEVSLCPNASTNGN